MRRSDFDSLMADASPAVKAAGTKALAASLAPPKRSVTDVLPVTQPSVREGLEMMLAADKAARKKPGIRVPKKKPKKPPAAVQIFLRLIAARGLPEPVPEYRFHRARRWRADFCWTEQKVILEIQGGIWTQGRHTRGKALLQEWQKLNTAAGMGYRFIFCQPTALNRIETIDQIEVALKYNPSPAAR